MKKLLYILLGYILSFHLVFADETAGGIFGNNTGSSLSKEDVRNGNIHIEDLPNIMKGLIDFLLGFAGTIAIIFIIIGAYKILFGSITQDKSKGKETIIMALTGFAISSLAWFIINFLISNLG